VASITLKALPSALHRTLKSRAARHRRSLNSEVIALLEAQLALDQAINVDAMLKRAQKLRAQMTFVATPEEIDRFKREGRA
jgi:plasmid stability protein